MVRNAVHNAFMNALTIGTAYPCVPSAFQQWGRHSYAFPLEMTPATMVHQALPGAGHAPRYLDDDRCLVTDSQKTALG